MYRVVVPVHRPEEDGREQHQVDRRHPPHRLDLITEAWAHGRRANLRRRRRTRRPGYTALRRPAARPRGRARRGLPPEHDVRRYAERQVELLDRLGHASSKAEEGAARGAVAAGVGSHPERGPGGRAAAARARAVLNVLVTGGSRGIGRAIALRLARDGAARVAIGYLRNDRAAEETAAELAAAGAEPCSSAATSPRERVLDEVAALGPLDVLVHNAASGVVRDALDTEEKHWDWTLGANARALLALTQAAAPRHAGGRLRSSASRRSAPRACCRATR